MFERLRSSRFLKFGIVGTGGFVVNWLVLFAALNFAHLDKYSGWVVAFLVAVTFTWWGNRTFTFRDAAADNGLIYEWARFFLANSLGAACNFLVYVVLVTFVAPPVGDPLVAVAAGTLVGLVFNFTTSQRFVFTRRSS